MKINKNLNYFLFFKAHERLLRITKQFKDVESFDLVVNHKEVEELLTNFWDSKPPQPGEDFYLAMPYEHKDIIFNRPVNNTKTKKNLTKISNNIFF